MSNSQTSRGQRHHIGSGVSSLPRRPQVSEHFPPSIAENLAAASQAAITESTPLARQIAIDKAVESARRAYPNLFRGGCK